MKKLSVVLLTPVLMLSSVASATTYIGLSTGGTSGTYYAVGAEIAALWNANMEDLDVTVQSSGGSKANIVAVVDGECEIAFSQNDAAVYAYQGTDYFDYTVFDNFYAMASLYPEAVQIVAPVDSGITCVADLKGKNVCVGDIGSGTYINAMHVLEAAGLTVEDINPTYLSFSEAANAMIDGQIDASFTTAGIPNPAIQEVTTKMDICLVELSDAEWAALSAKYPFYFLLDVEEGTYELAEAATIPAISATLIVSKDLDEDLVYDLTKVLFEKTAEMNHAKKEEIQLSTSTNGIMVPFHPGAARYLNEQNINTDVPSLEELSAVEDDAAADAADDTAAEA